jgi:polyhydroxyalkanoate depolymerase
MGAHPFAPKTTSGKLMMASADLFSGAKITHCRPEFGIKEVVSGGKTYPIIEQRVLQTSFASLLKFEKQGCEPQPKVLLVAPMSGHFATLLRETARTMLQDADVYITDWHNARDVPVAAGDFGFEDYVTHLIKFLEFLGPNGHIVAVCQPAVAALVAASVMAANRNPAQPRTITLMAGPIDTRISPTKVNWMAVNRPLDEFERSSISRVPWRFKGAYRRVYPGFLQLSSFMAMNADRHVNAHMSQLRKLYAGDTAAAEAHRRFYDEYFAIADLPAEFYLETVDLVFKRYALPQGLMTYKGEKVEPSAISRASLMVVEGERDDICGVGQCMAALELCTSIPPGRKHYHLQTGAGHYGVFSGRAWNTQIYPKLRTMIAQST